MSGLPPVKIDALDKVFFNEKASKVPTYLKSCVKAEYARKHLSSRREANLHMFDVEEVLNDFEHVDESDTGIKARSKKYAQECEIECLDGYEYGIEYCDSKGIEAPEIKNDDVQPVLNRMKCPKWWLRKLSVKRNRDFEHVAIKLGVVRKGRQEYCSDASHERVVSARQAGLEYLEMMELVDSCDPDFKLDMMQAYESSVSNPANKKAELYGVAVGMGKYAEKHGYRFEMVTLTCPSKYHANSSKYQGYSPKDSQAYLAEQWNRINTNLKDNNLSNFGIRVTEPHKDGTPHWHVWIAFKKDQINQANKIMANHAFSVDGKEAGAFKRRITFKLENKKKGSLVSYIFKYIMKTLDDANKSHEKSWASTWGIRQVQFLGGAPIGAWRELRRIKEPVINERMEEARLACHEGDYCRYFELQGGATTKRNDMPIRTLSMSMNSETGEVKVGMYGDEVERVKGIKCDAENYSLITRETDWIMQRKATDSNEDKEKDISGDVVLKPKFSSTTGRFITPWRIKNNSRNRVIDESEMIFNESKAEYIKHLKSGNKPDKRYSKYSTSDAFADAEVKLYLSQKTEDQS